MNEFLKGNFKVKRPPSVKEADQQKSGAEKIAEELRKRALNSLGGSMVYVDRENLFWDGQDQDEETNKK